MRSSPPRLAGLLTGALLAAALIGGTSAHAAGVEPGQVVVTPQAGSATAAAVGGTAPVTIATRPGETVAQAVARLRNTDGVADAVLGQSAFTTNVSGAGPAGVSCLRRGPRRLTPVSPAVPWPSRVQRKCRSSLTVRIEPAPPRSASSPFSIVSARMNGLVG